MDLPRKVLHVLNGAGGGAALSTIGLIEGLRGHGVSSCAVCHDSGTDEERELLREAVEGNVAFVPLYWWNRKTRAAPWKRPLLELRQGLKTVWTIRSTRAVIEAARKCNADLIHTNTLLTPEGGFAARKLGLPHVWHLRELVGPGQPFRLYREGAGLGKFLARYCDVVIANSHVTAAQVRDWIPDKLLAVVPNGIDASRFSPIERSRRGEPVVVAMVGSPTSRSKNHQLFIEAAALVDPALSVQFGIYGHDPSQGGAVSGDSYLDGLHQQVREMGLNNRFHWSGFIADPVEIMRQIDILVHPAHNESFGRIVAEAMAAGLPVVGVRGGGVGEIVQHDSTGLLAEPNSPRELANHIGRLVQDPALRERLGTAGRRRAAENYSLSACVDGVVQVYRRVLANRGSTAARNGNETDATISVARVM